MTLPPSVPPYDKLYEKHGDRAAGVGWANAGEQYLRFDLLRKVHAGWDPDYPTCPLKSISVLDVGCGYGAMADYYRKHGWYYTGIDAEPALIKGARQVHGEGTGGQAGLRFLVGDFMEVPALPDTYDFVLASGALHWKRPDDQYNMVERMWTLARYGIGFNLPSLSEHGILTWINSLAPAEYELIHGYIKGETTVLAWKADGRRSYG